MINIKRLFLFISAFILSAYFFVGCKKSMVDNKKIDHALINKTEELRLKGQTEEIIDLNKKYIIVSKAQNYKRGEILGYINIANVYAMIGQYNKGILNLNKAKNLLKNEKDDYLQMRLYHEYGQMNYVIGLSDIALKYNAQAIYYGKKIESDSIKRIISNLYTVRADFINSKFKDSTLIYFHKGLQEDDSELNNALIGNYQSTELHNQDSAKVYFDKSIALLQNQEYWTVKRGIVYTFYGYYLYGDEKLDESLAYLKKAAEILSKTNRQNKLPLIYANIIQISQLKKDKKTEEEYTQKYNKIKDDLQLSANKAIDVALSEALHDAENYKHEQNKNRKILLLVSAVCLLLIGLLSYIVKRRKKKIKELNDVENNTNNEKYQPTFEEIITLAKENSSELFIRFYEYNPDFIKKMYDINPDLSNADIEFCIMIWLGFSSKEIAQYTFMEHRSVQTKKYRLRKKLNLDSETDVHKFLRELSS